MAKTKKIQVLGDLSGSSEPSSTGVTSVNGKTGAVTLDIPENTSDLTNNSGFITNTVSNLTNYYLKSETYTQEEINNKLSAIPKFSIKPVSSLPTTDISETTVYLLKTGDESQNLYTEYIYVDGAWEYLGKQTVDLTGYALETDIPTKLSQLTNDVGFLTEITSEIIKNALGYTPADAATLSQVQQEIVDLQTALTGVSELIGGDE